MSIMRENSNLQISGKRARSSDLILEKTGTTENTVKVVKTEIGGKDRNDQFNLKIKNDRNNLAEKVEKVEKV